MSPREKKKRDWAPDWVEASTDNFKSIRKQFRRQERQQLQREEWRER
jgi:hypothetical protein